MDDQTNIQIKHFWCYECSHYWQTNDFKTIKDTVYSNCPLCNHPTKEVPQYFANLKKMAANATGPRTEAGKKRSSLNGFKTGLYSRQVHLLAPALHGKYKHCDNCEYKTECIGKDLKYCPINLEPMLRFLAAYSEGRVKDLKEFAGIAQGKTFMILQEAFNKVFDDGLVIDSEHPLYTEKKAHPLLKHIPELMLTLGFTSDQQEMNPKFEQETDPEDLTKTVDPGDFVKKLVTDIATAVSNIKKLPTPSERGDQAAVKTEEHPDKMTLPESNPFKK